MEAQFAENLRATRWSSGGITRKPKRSLRISRGRLEGNTVNRKRGWTKGQRIGGANGSGRKYQSTIDKKMRFARYSPRAGNCLPPVRTFRRSSPIRTPEKTSARSTGVGTNK